MAWWFSGIQIGRGHRKKKAQLQWWRKLLIYLFFALQLTLCWVIACLLYFETTVGKISYPFNHILRALRVKKKINTLFHKNLSLRKTIAESAVGITSFWCLIAIVWSILAHIMCFSVSDCHVINWVECPGYRANNIILFCWFAFPF